MKKNSIKLIVSILLLVIIQLVVISNDQLVLSNRVLVENTEDPRDFNWEYVKDRLFDEETENVYKISPRSINAPILINLQEATKEDSLAVEEIFKELRVLLPHKTIGYFENFTGEAYGHTKPNIYKRKTYKSDINERLSNSVIQMSFGAYKGSFRNRIVKTLLLDGSTIERNLLRVNENVFSQTKNIFFSLNSTISFDKRKQYIQYELLRALCYIHPAKAISYVGIEKGVYYTPNYVPEYAEFNEPDKFLLQKLYSDDFLEQFKEYLYANYPWRYANRFINKELAEMKAWVVIVLVGLLAFVLLFGFFQNRKFKYSYFNYFFPVVFLLVYIYHFRQIYSYFTHMNTTNTVTQFFSGLILLTIDAVIISFVLWISEMFEKKYLREDVNFGFQLLIKVVYTFLAFNFPFIISFLFIKVFSNWVEFYFPVFIITLVLATGRGLLIYLNHFSDSLIKEKDVELSHLKQVNAEAEVKLLQSQINPHFLYNALNSIASLAYTDAAKTEKMTLSLSDLFKYTINRKGKKTSTIKDEVEMVHNYLEIEQTRFGDRLEFVIEVDDALLNYKIPMFVLQPLVENAIKHGISKIEEQGKIVLQILKTKKGIEISVLDNGPHFPEGLVSGHGLQSVYDLLRLSYGDEALLKWQNTPEKRITILIDKEV